MVRSPDYSPPPCQMGILPCKAPSVSGHPINSIRTPQVRLKVKLRGEKLNEKNISIKDRFDLRAAAMNCFIDDPHLETYIQPFLDKIRKSLHTWYGTSLPVTSDPFKTPNVLAALQAAPVPLPAFPPSAFQAAPVLLSALPPSAFQAAPVPLPIPTAALSAPEAKQGTKR
jgi:hypothetical protein